MIFHPYEFSFCGFSNSGKTTLISKLVSDLSSRYRVGFKKHDAHQFEMDKKGKDTWVMKKAGANTISINDQETHAFISQYDKKNIFNAQCFSHCDFVIVEGFKKLSIPKAILLNGDTTIFDEVDDFQSISFFVYSNSQQKDDIPVQLKHLPCFERNEVEAIRESMMMSFMKSSPIRINGLVLSGGKSSRMGQDKSALSYREGSNQAQYLYNLLGKYCDQTFISCRADQSNEEHLKKLNQVTDRFLDFGPLGGILSAQLSDQNAYWLVIACDLPFVDKRVIEKLVSSIDPFKSVICYRNKHRREPLCAIYSPSSYQGLLQMLGLGHSCPQKYLWNGNVKVLELDDEKFLENANTYNEFLEYRKELIHEV